MVRLAPRDAQSSVSWIRESLPAREDPRPFDPEAYDWYHSIDLPGGKRTRGMYDHHPLLPHYGLPEDLGGATALDIGSANGFWAFELERRGAKVTALDIASANQLDLPPAAREIVSRELDRPLRRGIEYVCRERNSSIELVTGSVYALDPAEIGTFDFVHAGDILLHLRDPALALQRIRSVTRGQALLSDVFDPALDGLGAEARLIRYCGGWSVTTWWEPSLGALAQMVSDAGFSSVEILNTYMLSTRSSAAGPWRAIIRARP